MLVSLAQQPSAKTSAGEATFTIDPQHSKVFFAVGATLHTVHGEFSVKAGAIQFDSGTGKATGEIIVDTASGNSGNNSRDKRMCDVVLECSRFTEAVFRPDHVTGPLQFSGASNVQVHGIFTLHGVGHSVAIPVHMDISGSYWKAEASLSLPYVLWNLRNPGNFALKVSPAVNIDLKASGNFHLSVPR